MNERGAALVTVLILIVVLSVMGVAMVNAEMTEITIAYNQGDAVRARAVSEAGVARAIYELGANPAWPGVTAPIGDGQYQVTVTSSGTVRVIQSVGTRGGGSKQLQAAVKALPQFTLYAVLANTTATLGSGISGLTIRNALPSTSAGAVQASNRLNAATAITINPTGTTLVGGLTANGPMSGVSCPTWPWRCSTAFGALPFPRLDVDSAAPTSFLTRATSTLDPIDGLNLFFSGGNGASRCTSGGAWNFMKKETQRCWDKYVNDRNGVIGQGITNPVFFVQFNAGESTSYTQPIGGPPPQRTVDCIRLTTAVETLCVRARTATAEGICPPPALPCGNVEFPNSSLRQVTGAIVTFRRSSGTAVVGDIALEDVGLRTADYTHLSVSGDPAFLAAGQLVANSSAPALLSRRVMMRGFVYTLAGLDNPDLNSNLQGSASTGISIQHGADAVALIVEGFVMSNGIISIQKTTVNTGTVAIEYDSAVTDLLPTAFLSAMPGGIILPISWSSGD